MIQFSNSLMLKFPSRKPYVDIVLKVIDNINAVIKKIGFINKQISGQDSDEITEDFFGFGISLSIDEAIKNAIEHGNKNDITRPVEISYTITPDELKIIVKDMGTGFNHRIIPENPEVEGESGRGILLMKNFMDEVLFNETGNEVTLIKRRK